ncbi:MAG: PaaI family thioesterase [Lysobacterales bacterium]
MSTSSSSSAVQDRYPDSVSYCYGCGRNNHQGLKIRSYREGDQWIASFTPGPEHIAVPGFVYGGLLASLIDCHGVGTAAAASLGDDNGELEMPRFVTGSLNVRYLKPTPLGPELQLSARPVEVGERKVRVEISLRAEGVTCVAGDVVAVKIPDSMA